jgi:hypothetical protein
MDATIPDASSLLRSSEDCAQFLVEGHPELLDLMQAHGHDQAQSFSKDPFGRRDFRLATLKRAMPRLAVALGVWMLGLYFNNVSQAWLQRDLATYYEAAWQQRSRQAGPPVLWDFGHHALPGTPSTDIANAWPAVAFITATVRFLVIPGPMSMRWTICCRVFLLWGVLWGLRSLTLVATVLPNPDPSCKPRISHPDNIWLEAVALLPVGWDGPQVTCHDVLYSGHTVALTLAILAYMRYLDWAPWFPPSASNSRFIAMMKLVLSLCLFAGYYVIVASRFHYTIDVMVGSLFTLLVWKGYHGLVRQEFLPQRKSRPSFLVEGMQRFVCWFEADAVDVKAFQLALKGLP